MFAIAAGDLRDPEVIALVRHHAQTARAQTARGSAHAFDPADLMAEDVAFWTVREAGALLGCGALLKLSETHGEIKSMHVSAAARRRGVGAALLGHIMAKARAGGLERLSLETGSRPYFAPALALYATHGFVPCLPFGEYRPDPNSIFMTRTLSP